MDAQSWDPHTAWIGFLHWEGCFHRTAPDGMYMLSGDGSFTIAGGTGRYRNA